MGNKGFPCGNPVQKQAVFKSGPAGITRKRTLPFVHKTVKRLAYEGFEIMKCTQKSDDFHEFAGIYRKFS